MVYGKNEWADNKLIGGKPRNTTDLGPTGAEYIKQVFTGYLGDLQQVEMHKTLDGAKPPATDRQPAEEGANRRTIYSIRLKEEPKKENPRSRANLLEIIKTKKPPKD
ncbi:MAG: hypothetical protein V1870_01690 [Candidatus Aenigmatarchaeota archaeon]